MFGRVGLAAYHSMTRPPFQFGLASLFILMAAVGLLVWAAKFSIFWFLVAVALFGLVVALPFLLFFAYVYWLNRKHLNS